MISHGISDKVSPVHKELQNAIKTGKCNALSVLCFRYVPDVFLPIGIDNEYYKFQELYPIKT